MHAEVIQLLEYNFLNFEWTIKYKQLTSDTYIVKKETHTQQLKTFRKYLNIRPSWLRSNLWKYFLQNSIVGWGTDHYSGYLYLPATRQVWIEETWGILWFPYTHHGIHIWLWGKYLLVVMQYNVNQVLLLIVHETWKYSTCRHINLCSLP